MQSINVTTRQSLAEMLGVSMVSGNRMINDPFSGVSHCHSVNNWPPRVTPRYASKITTHDATEGC